MAGFRTAHFERCDTHRCCIDFDATVQPEMPSSRNPAAAQRATQARIKGQRGCEMTILSSSGLGPLENHGVGCNFQWLKQAVCHVDAASPGNHGEVS